MELSIKNKVIDDFLKIKNKININDDYKEKVQFSKIKGGIIVKKISSYFIGTLKKIADNQLFHNKNMSFIIREMMNTVLGIIGLDVVYCNKLLKYFGNGFLLFENFMKKYQLPDKYYKEYFYATFTGIMFLVFGKIKNFELYYTIIKLWILTDNVFDNKSDFEWKNDIITFFKDDNWKDPNIRKEIIKKGGPIMECVEKIENMKMNNKRKNGLYLRFYKLFKFCYLSELSNNKNNKSDAEKLEWACLKSKKSIDIFLYSLNCKRKSINLYDLYYYSLLIQLFDDLIDIQKDKIEGVNTIFTGDIKNNTVNAITLIEFLKLSNDKNMHIFYECSIYMFIDYNSNYFEEWFIQKIRKEINMMDLQYYNMREIDSIVDPNIMNKLIYIYLGRY